MRVGKLLLLLLFLCPFLSSAHAETTPTEAAAIAAANNDHTAYTLPPDKLAKAQHLNSISIGLEFGGVAWSILTLFLMLQLGIAARMRNVAVNLSKNRWAQGFTFVLQLLVLITVLNLPLSMYSHHLSVQYGFSVQSWLSWFGDKGKSFALTYIFGGLSVMLLFLLIKKFPRRWWLWLWFPTMAVTLITVYISPWLIDPLYNKFEPLQQTNPALVAELQKVVTRAPGINIAPERMFLMDASAKTTTVNAYVTGFGASKRVVIWDTLLKVATPDEISLIFGHEMGHYVLGHIVRGVLFSFVFILISFFLGFHLFHLLLRRFGARWRIPAQDNWASLVVFLLVLYVISFLGQPITNGFSRSMEHDADIYGQEAMHGIVADPGGVGQAAFQVLGENYLSTPDSNAFFDFWLDTHPPIWFRASFAKHYDPWAPGNQPKFFRK